MAVNGDRICPMKLDRLPSLTRSLTPDSAAKTRLLEADALRQVGQAESADPDRERSLQQELEAAKSRVPEADAPEPTLVEARDVAERLLHLGGLASTLLKPGLAKSSVDTEA